MTTDFRSTQQPARPIYPQHARGEKVLIALVAVIVSCMQLGGMLSIFELCGEDTVMAQASSQTPRG